MVDDAILRLNELDLLPQAAEMESAGWYLEAVSDDASMGDPEQTVVEIVSQLMDGSAVAAGQVGNREASFTVNIHSETAAGLAEGERALLDVCDRPGLKALAYRHPDASAALTVFDVLIAVPMHDYDDHAERNLRRSYTLNLTCKPWPRSEGLTLVDADLLPGEPVPPRPADVVVANGTSTAGFTVDEGASGPSTTPPSRTGGSWTDGWTPKYSGSAVWCQNDVKWATLGYTQTIDTTGRPFIIIEGYSATWRNWVTKNPVVHREELRFRVREVGGDIKRIRPRKLSQSRSTGRFRAILYVGETMIDRLQTQVWSQVTKNTKETAVAVDRILLTSGEPAADTTKIRARVIDIDGSKPAEGAISVRGWDAAGEPASLGHQTLVYSAPSDGSDFHPSLSQYRVSGGIRTDAPIRLSGGWSWMTPTRTNCDTYTIPMEDIDPGTYQIAGICNAAAAGIYSVSWRVTTTLPGTVAGEWQVTGGAANLDLPAGAGDENWGLYALGDVTLPLNNVEILPAGMELRVEAWMPDGDGNDVRLDTLLLFNISTGAVSMFRTDDNGTHELVGVRVDAPTSERPSTTYWCDFLDDAGEVYTVDAGYRVQTPGLHRFDPGPMYVVTITTGNDHSTVSASYYPRWATYAVGEPWSGDVPELMA